MCFVCAWHTRSAFPRNTQGTRPGVCEKDFLCLLLYVWVVSSSLESANTSQLLSLLRTRARASEPSSAGEFRHTTAGECCVLRTIKKHVDLTLHLHLCYLPRSFKRDIFCIWQSWPFPGRRKVWVVVYYLRAVSNV